MEAMALFHARILVVVLGCAMSACAARTPTQVVLPRADQVAPSQALAQVDDPRRAVSSLALDQPRVALSMDYGYPGSAGYRHQRPFDYFRIESSVSGEGLEHLSTRGLIAGTDYGAGPSRACGACMAPTTTSRRTIFASPARRYRPA